MNFALYGVRGIMQIQLEYYLLLAAALFCIGIYGLVTSRNAVRVLPNFYYFRDYRSGSRSSRGFSDYPDYLS